MTTYYNYLGDAMPLGGASTSWLTASSVDQTLDGPTAKNDSLGDGNLAGITLVGGSGNNTYSIGATSVIPDETATVIDQAATGINTVNAWANFALPANIEIATVYSKHVLVGNSDNDLLIANDAGGVLVDGSGTDVMVGSTAGDDTFYFGAGTAHDVIYNFISSGSKADIVSLAGLGFTSFSQVESDLSQVGSDVKLTLSQSASITFRNTTLSALTTSDFMLQMPSLSSLTPSFDGEFTGNLSLYNAKTKTGTWTTNYWFGNQSDWSSRTCPDNAELEIYVDPSYAGDGTTALGVNPFSVSNGVLSITANPTPSADLSALYGYKYTSGLLTTANSFSQEYGYFEIKAKLPSGQGLWPAFWLLPENHQSISELDIFEQIGGDTIFQTSHSNVNGSAVVQQGISYIPNLTQGFHTFGLLWTPQTVTWYIDGNATFQIATPADMDTPMYMLMNLAVGGSWPGNPSSNSEFPASMEVDYVHVYTLAQVESAQAGALTTGTTTTTTTTTSSASAVQPPEGDFLGTGKCDALIENTAGAVFAGALNSSGQEVWTQVGALGSEWRFDGAGDFLGDGKYDFLIENTSGAVAVGEVGSKGTAAYTTIASLGAEWKFVGSGDFLGDSKDQFLIENTAGTVDVGEVGSNDKAAYTTVASLGREWKFVATGDFTGAGKTEFLIENTSGSVAVGVVGSNHETTYTAVAALGSEWTFEAAADFLNNGKDQVLIKNTSGAVDLGQIGSNGEFSWSTVASLGPEWKFVGAGDYKGGLPAAFMIENTTGAVDIGTISNGKASFTQVAALGSEWAFHG
jgi:beta-glucanase (GH16 family)